MKSLWSATVSIPGRDALKGDLRTNVLIIGGGMAGLLCAHRMQQAGIPYALVEANAVCGGVTKCTTAKITVQHGLLYDQLLRRFGAERTGMYLAANTAALDAYRELCRGIDCDFRESDAFVYSLGNRKKLEREQAALNRLGQRAELVDKLPLPFPVAGALRLSGQAQFHPLKFAAAIAPGLHIYEHTRILELAEHRAVTDHGTITADKIIVATHFPFLNKHGSYFLKQYQHRSYVLALENAPGLHGMYVDEAEKGLSFRSHNGLLLIGGGSHRTGKQGGNWQELSDFSRRHYPNAKEVYRWATQDCMTLDGVPYIGQYSKSTPDFYVATGFNKWGMTASMVSAMLLTDLVQGRPSPYAAVFSPSRTMLRPQLPINALEAAVNLLTPSAKRCPHMGCALKWNAQERSWDCPCHGSRFAADGTLLDNPATGDLP